ncbi:hypothetical protein Tco_1220106 [Tanacetum coccineum]
MSSECNNVKLAIQNDKSKVICVMCYQCLITSNHDVCVLKYVNDINSRVSNLYANGSKTTNRKKHKPKVTKPKKVGSKERLTSPKPRNPRTYLRWSPTRRMFNLKGKIIESSESESQSDCSKGRPNLFMKFLGTVRFGNDHIAAILGYDLEVAFRRNTCFVRNLEGVDLLKGNRTTNLYTINLLEMAYASPICLMARATSTKSCFEWRKTVFEMVTSMVIRHAKAPNPLRLSKTWQSLKHPKNSSILSKPDRAHICTISDAIHYNKESKIEPRPKRTREVTPPLRTRSPRVCIQHERVVWFEEARNREGSRIERNTEGNRPSEAGAEENRRREMTPPPPLLAAHLGRNENRQPLQSSLTSVYGGRQSSINIGGNLPPNSTLLSHHAQPFTPSSAHVPNGFVPTHANPYS